VPSVATPGEAASAPGAAPAAPAGHRVTAPSVGLFWRSPKPGAPPFVEVGDEVRPDDTVCIVEVMKLMNHVRAGVAGTVRAVHPQNGEMVEHGDPLFTIEPAR
jgi:acetyl-CoA carboxylase biotin carboxyl carrier protein